MRIKAGCFLYSFLAVTFFLLFFDTMNQLSLGVSRRHENCSAKIRYNHCRRTRSETDSFRTSREHTAGNPSGSAYFFFLAFTLKIFYRIIQGKVCAWLLSEVHSLREVSTLMLRVISLTLVDATRWSSKSISVKETVENYVVYRACNVYFVICKVPFHLQIYGLASECREYVATFPLVSRDVWIEKRIMDTS